MTISHPAFNRLFCLQHFGHVVEQTVVQQIVGKAIDAPADVLRQNLERLADLRREFADAQLAVQKHRADVGAAEQVVHVVGQHGQLANLPLVLGVDGVQLFVDRVQFLVGALQFLVGCDEFFVGRLQFLVGRFHLLDGGLQVLAGITQVAFQRRARQNNRHGPLAHILRQRAEERIDGQRKSFGGVFVGQQQLSPGNDHFFLRRDQIDRIRLDGHPIFHTVDGDLRVTRKQLAHQDH